MKWLALKCLGYGCGRKHVLKTQCVVHVYTANTDDYRVTFGSNPSSTINTVHLSDDATTVILT